MVGKIAVNSFLTHYQRCYFDLISKNQNPVVEYL